MLCIISIFLPTPNDKITVFQSLPPVACPFTAARPVCTRAGARACSRPTHRSNGRAPEHRRRPCIWRIRNTAATLCRRTHRATRCIPRVPRTSPRGHACRGAPEGVCLRVRRRRPGAACHLGGVPCIVARNGGPCRVFAPHLRNTLLPRRGQTGANILDEAQGRHRRPVWRCTRHIDSPARA